MNDFLDFLSYLGGLLIGLTVFIGVLFVVGVLIFLIVFRLLFGESMREVLNRRHPIIQEEAVDEYP